MTMTIELSPVVASIPDDRDYPYITLPGPFAQKLDLKPNVFEVEDQGRVGSCTANSTVSACELLKPASYSRLFPYWVTRNVVENRAGQEGASLRNAIRALYHYGTPPEALWPYDAAQVDVRPIAEAWAAATGFEITRYERITTPRGFGIPPVEERAAFELAIKSSLSEGLPVVFACRVGEQIRTLTGPWQTHKMAIASSNGFTDNKIIGLHAMLIIGNDDTIQNPCPGQDEPGSWLVQNSWSAQWGDGGFMGYPYAALNFDVMEAWIVRGFEKVLVNPVTPAAEVIDWFHKVYRNDMNDPADKNIIYWCFDKGFPRSFLGTWRDIVLARVKELEDALP